MVRRRAEPVRQVRAGKRIWPPGHGLLADYAPLPGKLAAAGGYLFYCPLDTHNHRRIYFKNTPNLFFLKIWGILFSSAADRNLTITDILKY